jgi:hypothetical protein
MKTAFATLLLLALFTGPTLCLLAVCPAQATGHACCPDEQAPPQQATAFCPFDILTESTVAIKIEKIAAGLAIAGPIAVTTPVAAETGHAGFTVVANGRNLHELNRVLRI